MLNELLFIYSFRIFRVLPLKKRLFYEFSKVKFSQHWEVVCTALVASLCGALDGSRILANYVYDIIEKNMLIFNFE